MIADLVREDRAADLVAEYFLPSGPFAGSTFDLLGDNPPDEFVPADALAVSLLDVSLEPRAVRSLLVDDREEFAQRLAAVPLDVALWDADEEVIASATALYWRVRDLHGVGPTRASKLLARKRPLWSRSWMT